MNVLICVTTLNYGMGGVSTHILDLCRQYSNTPEIEHIFVTCDGGEHISKLCEIPRVNYISIPYLSFGLSIKGIFDTVRLLKPIVLNNKIDIIHVHSQRIIPAAQIIKMIYRVPFIWTNHIDEIPNPRILELMIRLFRFPIISVSKSLHDLMIREYHCSSKNVYTVNNGTDLDQLTPLAPEERIVLEEKLEIDRHNKPYVISLLSRVNWAKGHLLLLKAINLIPEKNKIKIIFAGHTYPDSLAYKQEVIEFAREHSIDCTFLDFSKPRDIFGMSDLFVLPSLYEGFALVCIEALAMGCAVIRSRTPGWHEMDQWVETVEKNDIPGLADRIHSVIINGFNREKTLRGQAAVFSKFTKEQCAKQTLQVYRNVIARMG